MQIIMFALLSLPLFSIYNTVAYCTLSPTNRGQKRTAVEAGVTAVKPVMIPVEDRTIFENMINSG